VDRLAEVFRADKVEVLLAQQQNLNIVCAENLRTSITVTLEKVPLSTALDSILAIAGCSWVRENDVIYVTSVSERSKLPPAVQGRQVRVFRLDFASATDVEKAVKGMLSPVGQCFTTISKATDNRQTQEIVVVEDVPAYLDTIAQCVAQIDQPPRQVMIEAHVLAVTLDSNDRCGVNLTALAKVLNHDMKFYAQGIANPTAPQAFFFSYDGSDLDLLIEALRTQSNAKTLASPKVLVLNGQEAKIQVGRQLGFRVVTTTETSSMETINFLNVGVVLTVTPRISRDGQVLMRVKPEVSKGEVNPDTGLPEEDTTQVETNILLPDGRGMVIGGLIQEKDIELQSKVPFFGDIYLVGKLFRRRELTKQRQEIIITLVPRIVPATLVCGDRHSMEVQKADTPLVDRNLERVYRPWDGMLPDAIENPAHLADLPAVKQHAARKYGPPCPDVEAPSTACGESEPYYGGTPMERTPR
jgi:type II secretory pathway component GspD/PulD (secretin)